MTEALPWLIIKVFLRPVNQDHPVVTSRRKTQYGY